MAPPSQLSIATSSVARLVKEEASYHKELISQQARLKKLEEATEEDENREYSLKQERAAIEETKAVFPPLRERLADAILKLEDLVQRGGEEAEENKANEVIAEAKKAVAAGN
ncbi:e39791df-3724-4e0e-860a-05c273d725a2 [Sclerotinia trifoliorum]|uniref:Tubulin-specific chaperone A n=1 Tax=Sclerotinia trifoliorum TaxID=28548 RepID=A0A8H2W653_9HELO|nr:e39791df-3724-4e0e-860a-05c273d725a2 [Sclerotinia trifoliorum]